ncbi:MAG: penicillin-binding protein 1A [Alphaproteobacteria bacterium]
MTTRRRKPRTRSRFLRVLAALFVAGFTSLLVAAIAFAVIIQSYVRDLPSVDQLANYDPPVVTRLYANNSKLLAEYATEKRFFLPLSAIPVKLQQAFIAVEDSNFYQHQGIDFLATLRAISENVMNYGSGKSMVGGSTITQQVVKNFLLTSEKSFERKFKEAILAYRISNLYSKEKILELYLNQIYLGQGTYGVAAAALNYFNKSLEALTIEEMALLAALPKAPAYYDPAKNYAPALERRNYVISRMAEEGFVTQEEARRAQALPIIINVRATEEIARADFFAEEVRRNLREMYGHDVLYEGGLFVKTTLDPAFQVMADRALRHALTLYDRRHGYRGPIARMEEDLNAWEPALTKLRAEKEIPLYENQALAVVLAVEPKVAKIGVMGKGAAELPFSEMQWAQRQISDIQLGAVPRAASDVVKVGDVLLVDPVDKKKTTYRLLQIPKVNGALVVMDPHTGKVLAMSGGYSYAGSEFNRATQARRQPGSVFKPLVYLTALENGFSPTSIILDAPVEMAQGPNQPLWRPKNYEDSYLGPTTLRMGLEKSRNTMTVRIAQMLGINRIKRVAQRLGIYDAEVKPDYSMVLGSKETTLLQLTNAYAMIANGGRRVSPWFIERIDDRNGTTIFRRDTRLCELCKTDINTDPSTIPPVMPDDREMVLDPRVAYQMTSILEGVIRRGTGTAAKKLGIPVAGKTGTTNQSRDTWFIGFTPDLVIGTYIGFDTPRPMGGLETGGRVAIEGFTRFLEQALASKRITSNDFRVPSDIRRVPVNRYTGQPLFEGEAADPAQIIDEAFLVGGTIFKPQNELEEELKDRLEMVVPEEAVDEGFDPYAPERLTTQPVEGTVYAPAPGEMAPYQIPQRPLENPPPGLEQGFDPDSETSQGTGGLY